MALRCCQEGVSQRRCPLRRTALHTAQTLPRRGATRLSACRARLSHSCALLCSLLFSASYGSARRGALYCRPHVKSTRVEWNGMEWNGRVERFRKQSSLRAANARDCVASCGFIRVEQQLTCSAYTPHRTHYTARYTRVFTRTWTGRAEQRGKCTLSVCGYELAVSVRLAIQY